MGRVIVNNRTELPDIEALTMVLEVMALGRISNDGKQYCYLAVRRKSGIEYHVVTDLRKKSDSFIVYKVQTK